MPLVFFETFGCQMNVADTDSLAAALAAHGFTTTQHPDAADLVVVNTCSVRERAEKRALARIAELSAHKKRDKNCRLLWVIGCMAQRLGDSLKRDFPAIDLVVGARDFERFIRDIDAVLGTANDSQPHGTKVSGVSRFVAIMRGCDNHCSYCVVPQVRGPESSVPAKALEETVRSLVDKGVREVTLLGQNVNSYCDGDEDFPRAFAQAARNKRPG